MGTAFSIVGISVLIGTPIEGALLRTRDGGLLWARAIVFCGVRVFFVRDDSNFLIVDRVWCFSEQLVWPYLASCLSLSKEAGRREGGFERREWEFGKWDEFLTANNGL